jgi:hypothetical protein
VFDDLLRISDFFQHTYDKFERHDN